MTHHIRSIHALPVPTFRIFCLSLLLVWGIEAPSIAATKNWTGGTSSDWSVGSNWSPGGTPVGGDSVILPTGGGNRTINLAGNRSIVDLTFNSTNNYRLSNNELTLTSGDITSLLGGNHRIDSNVVIADQAAWNIASGTLTVTGSINTATPTLFGIHKSGAGTLEFRNIGTNNSIRNLLNDGGKTEFLEGTYSLTSQSFDANSAMYIGAGTVTVSKNANIVGTSGGNLVIQSGGSIASSLVITGEETEVATFGQVFLGASGSVANNITVENRATLRDIGLIVNGFNGNSSMTIRDRGTVETGSMAVGMLTGVNSTLNIENVDSSVTTTFLALGGFNSAQKGGTGIATITDRGSLAVTGELRFFSSTSSLVIDSATATVGALTNEPGVSASIKIRNTGGTPALTINSPGSGAFTFDGVISNNGGSGGILKQGLGEQVFTKQQTYTGVTRIDAGTLTLGTANTLAPTGPITATGGTLNLGNNPQQVGAVTLQGGTISGGTTGLLLPTSLALQSGTISAPTFTGTVNKTTGGTATLNAPISAAALNVNAGTLVLAQGATAAVQVNAGTLNLKGNVLGSLTSAPGSSIILSGATLVNGPATIAGSLAVGSSTFVNDSNQPLVVGNVSLDRGTIVASQLDVTGTFAGGGLVAAPVVFENLSTLKIELGGTTQATEYDHLDISDALTLGGMLDVSLLGDFAPTAGMSFDILDWGTLTGNFAAISLPELEGLAWDLSDFYQTGTLSVVAALAADFNLDGEVNGEDLEIWQAGYATGTTRAQGDADSDGDVDGRDFLAWQRSAGGSPDLAAQTAVVNSVPEPNSLILLLAAASALAFCKR